MLGDIFNELYDISERIYLEYNNNNYFEILDLINEEKQIYKRLNCNDIINLETYVANIEEETRVEDYDNYEIILYGTKSTLIIRRIFYKIERQLIESMKYKSEREAIKIEKNKLLVMPDIYGSYVDLSYKLSTNIEIKFLYFLSLNNNIEEKFKSKIINQMMFVNDYIESRLLKNSNINLNDEIKKEDELKNNLWENIKEKFNQNMYDFLLDSINYNIDLMISDIDLYNKVNTEIRKTYLRTLFNCLNEEELSIINYNFRNKNNKIYNNDGYNAIIDAFKNINKDKQIIKQIKTH